MNQDNIDIQEVLQEKTRSSNLQDAIMDTVMPCW